MKSASQLAARATTMLAATAVVVSCSSTAGPGPTSTSSTGSSSPPATKPVPTLATDAFDLTISGVESRRVVASETPSPQSALPAFLSARSSGAEITLPGASQPREPLTLSFGFDGKAIPPVSDDVVPVVVAISDGSSQPEVLRSQWNPATKTLIAETGHLSSFFPALVDLKAVGDMFTTAVNGYLGIAGAKPGCAGQPLKVGDVTYHAEPESVPATWPCLALDGDTISVDLHSNSPNGWLVQSDPTSGDMTIDLAPDVNNLVSQAAYQTIFAASVGNGTFLLPGGRRTCASPRTIHLR